MPWADGFCPISDPLAMMRVVISGVAAAWDRESGAEISDPAVLSNLEVAVGGCRVCSDYFDDAPLLESGITGGELRVRYNADTQELRITTEYKTPRALAQQELDALIRETRAQWSDGLGEGAFNGAGAPPGLWVQPLPPGRDPAIRVEQTGAGALPRPRREPQLIRAAQNGDSAGIRRALARGELVDVPGQYRLTPLHWAVRNQHEEAARVLLEHGADPNVRDETGMSPLSIASALGAAGLVRLLLHHGADVNGRQHPDEATVDAAPLLMACNRRQLEVGRILVANAADVNLRDASGFTPLAMLTADDVELARLLIEHGANLHPGKWLRKPKPSLLRRLGL
jgi:hypothetical protein